ncbi:polysaccharide biosynthesis/export family protein [Frigoriglobus tundricola]|uniref:Polysaccharide export lipoprotein Wza n=1 Tax=Frigoriglobus tundricola TaxID=2774151 RepID=A0A6M5Z1T4_9BACT|nr:polysaccharide biosynthesis/export family protein [Frigoriglobus tundricola]QJW99696.1 Polysaccharide export lipoprotein Wza [Frigoriglobus tundricola]
MKNKRGAGTAVGRLFVVGALVLVVSAGCQSTPTPVNTDPAPVPRELQKVSHPRYVIEPPDILQLDLLNAVPKAPYKIRPLDVVGVSVSNALPASPVNGPFSVGPDGTIDLGAPYGTVSVTGLSLEQARLAVVKVMSREIKDPLATVSLVQARGTQQIRGLHIVRADGVVGLGSYGEVSVVGLTVAQAKEAFETHLSKYFQDPEVALDVVGYNSKVYYVVFEYGGAGQQVVRLPATGNETVLDGIAQVNGLPTVADPKRICLSRPGPEGCAPQMMPIDWRAIIQDGDTRTNYQILPGDRILVKAYPLVETDVRLARIISPIERMLGVTLLGSSTVNSIRTNGKTGTTSP